MEFRHRLTSHPCQFPAFFTQFWPIYDFFNRYTKRQSDFANRPEINHLIFSNRYKFSCFSVRFFAALQFLVDPPSPASLLPCLSASPPRSSFAPPSPDEGRVATCSFAEGSSAPAFWEGGDGSSYFRLSTMNCELHFVAARPCRCDNCAGNPQREPHQRSLANLGEETWL